MTDEIILDRYLVRRTLGRGRNGEVLLCHDQHLDRLVAVKRSLDATKIVERDEAIAAAKLTHPNSVRVYDYASDYTYLISEYVDGDTLQTRLKENREEVLAHFFEIANGLVDGLRALQEVGLIHRDLKPANILFREDSWAPLINDYGLAVEVDADKHLQNLAWRYMPIEAWREWTENPARDPTAPNTWDLHSLGVIFYEIWSGDLPYGEGQKEAIGLRVANGNPAPLERQGLPLGMARLVSRMIVAKIRPRSLAEVQAELAWMQNPEVSRIPRLDDFRQHIQHLYGERNVALGALDFSAHIGGNFKEALRGVLDEVNPEHAEKRFLPRLLAWLCALSIRLNYTPSEVLASKYGVTCPYCHRSTCATDCSGSTSEGRQELVAQVRQGHYHEVHAERSWREHRDAIADIYGPRNASDTSRFEADSLRAVIALTEALSRAPELAGSGRPVIGVYLATVWARFLALLNFMRGDYDLEAAFLGLYSVACPDCGLTSCKCGPKDASASLSDLV